MLTTSALRCSAPAARSSSRALAVEEHDRADVDVELHVDVLGLVLVDRGADAHAGVVDEDVQPAEGLAVAGHDGAHGVLVREVGRDVLDLRTLRAQGVGGSLEQRRACGRSG